MRLSEALRRPDAAAWKLYRRVRARLLAAGAGDPLFRKRFRAAFPSVDIEALGAEADSLEAELQERWEAAGDHGPRTGLLEASCRRWFYIAVRHLRPETMVETGVANGASSFFALAAMERSGRGRLWSFEPEGRSLFVAGGREPGWLVPDRLRKRWRLVRRPSLAGMRERAGEIGGIDVFFHDSDHTYDLMKSEYEAAWPRLQPGGLLMSDDVFFNEAFPERSAREDGRGFAWRNRLGFLPKR